MEYWKNLIRSSWNYVLESLGFANKSGNLVVLGLDCAGKTTLLQRLQGLPIRTLPPTDRPTQQGFSYGRLNFQAWDLGGHEAVRHLWTEYSLSSIVEGSSNQVSAIIFVVDSADVERLPEAQYELEALVHSLVEAEAEDDIAAENTANNEQTRTPVAILYNKCDLSEALPTQELDQLLELDQVRPHLLHVQTFRVSVYENTGYPAALQWIGDFL